MAAQGQQGAGFIGAKGEFSAVEGGGGKAGKCKVEAARTGPAWRSLQKLIAHSAKQEEDDALCRIFSFKET